MTELKPCPFCGSDKSEVRGTHWKSVWCLKCDCAGPEKEGREEAIAAWNERAEG